MKQIKYCFRVKKTGELAQITWSSNEGADFCGDNTYTLEDYGNIIFEVSDFGQALRVLKYPQEWYNSGINYPCLGTYKPYDLEIVKVTTITEIETISQDEINSRLMAVKRYE